MDHHLEQLNVDNVHSAPRVDLLQALPDGPLRFRSVYIHVPFCFHKCHYCDFYSIVDSSDRQEAFVERLELEIEGLLDRVAGPIETVFVGGGTPTLLRPDLLERLLHTVGERLPLSDRPEWTIEAVLRPSTTRRAVARG